MYRYLALFLFAAYIAGAPLRAQPPNSDCSTAVGLCAEQPQAGNNTGAVGWPGFCPTTENLVWYTFQTNSLGGPATVLVDAIDCPIVPGMDDEMSAVVLSGDGSCLAASFTAASACAVGTDDITLVTQALLPNTTYWLVIAGVMNGGATIAAQCGFEVSVSGAGVDVIGVDMSAGPDVTIGEGETTQLDAFGGPPYDWSPLSGLSANGIADPVASPASSTVYTLTTVIDGCTYTDEVEVSVIRRIDPPNTFTPNGDGFNDEWLIPGIADYPGAEVQIHDRWGQIIYKGTGYREPWDGTRNGRDLAVGTYYYYIKLNQLEGETPPYTGFISIVR